MLCAMPRCSLLFIQSAISRGFHTDALRSLAQLYIEHAFLSEDEAETFLTDIPVLGERDEPEATVSNQMLRDPQSDMGNLVNFATNPDKQYGRNMYSLNLNSEPIDGLRMSSKENRQVFAAIVGPAGTGKSYLLTGLIELVKSKGLLVSKQAPSGVAANLIGGTTIHNFFSLDTDCNSGLENGTIQVTKVKKTDILVIDEFSMLDFLLFRTAEGLCRKFAKSHQHGIPWDVIMLDDPAQLPSPGRRDIFGTHLWRTFTILVLREIKRCHNPVLGNVLAKVRMGDCDEEVVDVLSNLIQPPDVDKIELDRTVVICSTRKECADINDECIKNVVGEVNEFEALDTDHHGHPLREADRERIQRILGKTSRQTHVESGCPCYPQKNYGHRRRLGQWYYSCGNLNASQMNCDHKTSQSVPQISCPQILSENRNPSCII